jgi:tetratricopeptide (TPR) repeat protein
MRALLSVATAVFAVGLAQAPARAQPADDEAIQISRTHFERAQRYEELEDWPRAAAEYEEAYRHYPAPGFLFNLGEVYRLAGDAERAVYYFERYLEEDPHGRGSAAARESLAELKEAVADKQADEPEAAADAEPAEPEHEFEADDLGEVVAQPRAQNSGRTLQIAGIATAGVSAALFSTGIVYGARASSISSELSSTSQFSNERYDQGRKANRRMYVMYGLGTATAATAGALYFFGHQQNAAESRGAITLSPALTPGGLGIFASGTF